MQDLLVTENEIKSEIEISKVDASTEGQYECVMDFGSSGTMRNPVKLDFIGTFIPFRRWL